MTAFAVHRLSEKTEQNDKPDDISPSGMNEEQRSTINCSVLKQR